MPSLVGSEMCIRDRVIATGQHSAKALLLKCKAQAGRE